MSYALYYALRRIEWGIVNAKQQNVETEEFPLRRCLRRL